MRFVILVSGLVVGCSAKDEGGSGVLGARSADSGDAEGDDGTDASGPNEPPTSASISLLPVAPTTMDDLVVTIDVPATDPDGDDLEYIYTWYRDGDARDDISTDTAGALFTRRGEVWEVSVQATDGRELGEEVSVEVVIENSLPTVSEIRIDPEEVYEATEVTCVVGETDDADHDPIQAQVRWMVDGSQLDREGPLTGEDFDKDQTLTCRLYLSDDVDPEFYVDSDPVTVLNTAPNVVGVDISPPEPEVGDNIEAVPIGWYDEDDVDSEQYIYTWFVNFVYASSNSVLTSDYTDAGDNVYLELMAFDGTDEGNKVTSHYITVENKADDPTD